MATLYENVVLALLNSKTDIGNHDTTPVRLEVKFSSDIPTIKAIRGTKCDHEFLLDSKMEVCSVGETGVVVSNQVNENKFSVMLCFDTIKDKEDFIRKMNILNDRDSIFKKRTEKTSAEQYFQFYGYLSQQQNMMQDYIRTSTYQKAMLENTDDFTDKVVLDVGAGSGILSFFAVQAGAKKVYAIEASSIAKHCATLVKNNKLSEKITVVVGKVEEVEIPEKVDIIISEPMGYMLFNERMLETYIHAKKWLKPNGKMFPTEGHLFIAPFTDEALHTEQYCKANFWYQPTFHGVDLQSLREAAVDEFFVQPIVDTFDIRICLSKPEKFITNFLTSSEEDLHDMKMPCEFTITQTGAIHGLAFWFDVNFIGSQKTVWLSTSPSQPLTHWYQVRCLLSNPVFVKTGQIVSANVHFISNKRQSYDVEVEVTIPGTNTKSFNTLDLKNPFFRYTAGQPIAPAGTQGNVEQSPTELYYEQPDQHNNVLQYGEMQPQPQMLTMPPSVVTPINPGSISSATVVAGKNSTIVNGQFVKQEESNGVPTQFAISNQYMIGDYAIPTNNIG